MFVQLTLTNGDSSLIYFGDEGVVKLITINNMTSLINRSNNTVAVVLETIEQISNAIGAKKCITVGAKVQDPYKHFTGPA